MFVTQVYLLTVWRPPGPVGGRFGLYSEHNKQAAVLTRATGITHGAVQKARGYKYPHDSCKSLPDGAVLEFEVSSEENWHKVTCF